MNDFWVLVDTISGTVLLLTDREQAIELAIRSIRILTNVGDYFQQGNDSSINFFAGKREDGKPGTACQIYVQRVEINNVQDYVDFLAAMELYREMKHVWNKSDLK